MRITMKITLAVLLILLAIVAIIYLVQPDGDNENGVKTFSLDEYSAYIEQFPCDKKTKSITNMKDAKQEALNIWTAIYGEDVLQKKPYIVFFDEKEKVWMVQGTLEEGRDGGVPYILMSENGEILAVWHDK